MSRSYSASRSLHCLPVHSSSNAIPFFDPLNPFADVGDPFTPAFGVPIAPKASSQFEGTGSLYLREGGERNRVFLLTARHVVLPPSEYRNEFNERKNNSLPRRDVILLGSKAFQNARKSIMGQIGLQALAVDHYKNVLVDLGEAIEGEDAAISGERDREREHSQGRLAKAQNSIRTLNELHTEITKFWTLEKDRILGHVVHSPPISGDTGDICFAEDWALVELRDEKIDWNSFKGNVTHLGTFRSISLMVVLSNYHIQEPKLRLMIS